MSIFELIKDRLNEIIGVTVFLVFLVGLVLIIYYREIHPKNKKIEKVINKFSVDDYIISSYVAERYVIWNNMRTFYFALDYSLTLLGIFTSLMVVFYASIDNAKNYIIFLSLMSLCCTIANIFANSKSLSLMAQRVWRELDMCIAKISMDSSLTKEEKNKMLMEKIIELEKSIENYEH